MRRGRRHHGHRRRLLLGALEPAEGIYDFGWLDRVIDLLHAQRHRGRPRHRHRLAAAVVLAPAPRQPAASPPTGVRLRHGAPAGVLPELAGLPRGAPRLAGRSPTATATTPPSRCGTCNNEYGCHNVGTATATTSAAAFRAWLSRRYGTSTASTTPGARRSGASTTSSGTRSCRRGPPPMPANPPSSWTCGGSRLATSYSPASRPSATSCARSRPSPDHHQLHGTACFKPSTTARWARRVDLVANDHYLHRRGARPPRSSSRWPPT